MPVERPELKLVDVGNERRKQASGRAEDPAEEVSKQRMRALPQ